MTDERWDEIMRLVHEAFQNSETRAVALRKRVVADLKRKLALLRRPAGLRKHHYEREESSL